MLSKRLSKIASMIDLNKVVYDVGSDHGLLPCFLVLNGISPKAYASDNKIGPLNKAKENINYYKLNDSVIPVLADGIEAITSDVNIITICGMGFYTVKHILDNKDLSSYDKIIVQVNKEVDKLRKWIDDNNYFILDEDIVYDDFYYEIVVFSAKKDRKLTDLEIKYGPINLIKKEDIFKEYLNFKKDKLIEINKKANSNVHLEKIKELNDIIESF